MSSKNLLEIMLTEKHITIREATTKEDLLIAKHSYQMWLDIGVQESNIHLEWQNITLKFIEEARRDLFYKAFVAEVDNTVVGSVNCQLFAGLYQMFSKMNTANLDIFGAFMLNNLTADKELPNS
ncbi:MAG: hypothetical protein V7K41_13420 [Nostoc sp.]|uniref:hypothetical protein n=1 Tax=Nostoc sp. TaxID=1180 RepID=UPI002FFBE262